MRTWKGRHRIFNPCLAILQADAKKRFSALGEPAQDDLLRRHEASEFFGQMRFLTVAGTFAMSRHGGNREHLGWQMLGFDDRHAWTPPFGFYDTQANDYAGTQS